VRHKYQGEIEYKEGNFEVPKKIFPKRLGYIKLRVNSKWGGECPDYGGKFKCSSFCEDWRIQSFFKNSKKSNSTSFFLVVVQVEFVVRNSSSI